MTNIPEAELGICKIKFTSASDVNIFINARFRPSLHRGLRGHAAHSEPEAGSSLLAGYLLLVSAPSPKCWGITKKKKIPKGLLKQ